MSTLFLSDTERTVLANTRVSQKVKGLKKKHIYFKYTETKLMLLFIVIPLDFSAPVPALYSFLNSVRKKFF
jgi:hypothetical protein